MGLFDMIKPSAPVAYEIPYSLSSKEIARLEKSLFAKDAASPEIQRLLCAAGPMLAKNEESANRFPVYQGKKAKKLLETYTKTYGDATAEGLLETAKGILCDKSEVREELFRITMDNEQRHWSMLALRQPGILSEQSEKLNDITKLYDRMGLYGLPYPPNLSGYETARAANLACIGVGLEILTQKQAVHFLQHVLAQMAANYASWEEYLAGYLLGRAFWLYCGEKYLAMSSTTDLNICRVLLNAADSPFLLAPLRESADESPVSARNALHPAESALTMP